MKPSHLMLLSLIILSLVIPSLSLHIQINNIHHGYKTIVEGVSQVIQRRQGDAQIILTNLKWQMDQLEPELIPFFKKISDNKVSIDLSNQMIQGVFEQDNQVILLVFKQNTSIITTVTLRPHPDQQNQNLSMVSSVIKADCQWSEQAL